MRHDDAFKIDICDVYHLIWDMAGSFPSIQKESQPDVPADRFWRLFTLELAEQFHHAPTSVCGEQPRL